jgi:two-component system response regulator DevR
LPDGSGLDFLRLVRAANPRVPALVLTGVIDHDVANAAFDLRAQYLVKPATPVQIRDFLQLTVANAVRADSLVEPELPRSTAIARQVRAWSVRYRLSPSEGNILAMAVSGHPRDGIAIARGCSALTIQKHISNLLRKTSDESFHDAVERLLRESAAG